MSEYKKLRPGSMINQMSRTVYNDTIDMLRWWKKQKSKPKAVKAKAKAVRTA